MELGTRLKEARDTKEMSLEEVQAATKIQKRYLQAIEENDFDALPGKFYTRAFIREYASTVGLNPEEVMEEYRSELPSMEEETTIPYTGVQTTTRDSSDQKKPGKSSKVFPAIITVALICVIAFVIYFFTQQLSTPSETGADVEEPQDEVVISGGEDTPKAEGDGGESSDGNAENEQGSSEDDKSSDGQGEEDTNDETKEDGQTEVTLQQTGSGSFPEHTYQVTGTTEKQLSLELSGKSYLQVQASDSGEDLIEPVVYTSDDSPLTIDVSSYEQVSLKTGSAGVLTVSVDDEQLEFPTDLTTQKLLINFE
ncbi:helix-turn-helix domain-containing protein [Salimicrobium sp. PL1-032A]|uniref:helix-turn-helix domain-containing protein n=1 Tax=Salimicrobium sp. PL1-032A TaxID=3095364 RepID=UPI0032616989